MDYDKDPFQADTTSPSAFAEAVVNRATSIDTAAGILEKRKRNADYFLHNMMSLAEQNAGDENSLLSKVLNLVIEIQVYHLANSHIDNLIQEPIDTLTLDDLFMAVIGKRTFILADDSLTFSQEASSGPISVEDTNLTMVLEDPELWNLSIGTLHFIARNISVGPEHVEKLRSSFSKALLENYHDYLGITSTKVEDGEMINYLPENHTGPLIDATLPQPDELALMVDGMDFRHRTFFNYVEKEFPELYELFSKQDNASEVIKYLRGNCKDGKFTELDQLVVYMRNELRGRIKEDFIASQKPMPDTQQTLNPSNPYWTLARMSRRREAAVKYLTADLEFMEEHMTSTLLIDGVYNFSSEKFVEGIGIQHALTILKDANLSAKIPNELVEQIKEEMFIILQTQPVRVLTEVGMTQQNVGDSLRSSRSKKMN